MSTSGKKTKRPEAIIESTEGGTAAKITRPDGVVSIARSAGDLLDEMMYCGGQWSGAVMVDKRGWKFSGEY